MYETNFGGVMYIKNDNAAVTVIKDSTFHNNFGSGGGSILLERGGGFYLKNSVFSNDEKYMQIHSTLM